MNTSKPYAKHIPGLSRMKCGKHIGDRKRNGKASTPTTPPPPIEEYFETINLMPPYVPPRCRDAPRVTIPKRIGAPLIVPLVPKEVKVLKDIFPNVRKLSYADHDMKVQADLDRQNYMDI